MSTMDKINELSNKLPIEVFEDINKRISDWLEGGGNLDDPYIEQQLRYAQKFI